MVTAFHVVLFKHDFVKRLMFFFVTNLRINSNLGCNIVEYGAFTEILGHEVHYKYGHWRTRGKIVPCRGQDLSIIIF